MTVGENKKSFQEFSPENVVVAFDQIPSQLRGVHKKIGNPLHSLLHYTVHFLSL